MSSSPTVPSSQDANNANNARAERADRRATAAANDTDGVTFDNPAYAGGPPTPFPQPIDSPIAPPPAPPPMPPSSNPPPAPTSAAGHSLSWADLAAAFKAVSQPRRHVINVSKLDQLPREPSQWNLKELVLHVNCQPAYFHETFPGLSLDECIAAGHWHDFIPHGASILKAMISTAMTTGSNRVGPLWSRYVNALIQVFIPHAWGNASPTVMNALARLTVGPQGLPTFVHDFRQLHDLLATIGTLTPDATRTVDLISRLDQNTRRIICDYQTHLGHQNQQATFDDVCNRLLQFGPPTVAPPTIGAMDAVPDQWDQETIFALSSGGGRSGPGSGNARGSYRPSGQANRQTGATKAPNYPQRLRAGARLCLSLAFSGVCNNPQCTYLHKPALADQYLEQIQQELNKLQAGAKLRSASATSDPQHALRGA